MKTSVRLFDADMERQIAKVEVPSSGPRRPVPDAILYEGRLYLQGGNPMDDHAEDEYRECPRFLNLDTVNKGQAT